MASPRPNAAGHSDRCTGRKAALWPTGRRLAPVKADHAGWRAAAPPYGQDQRTPLRRARDPVEAPNWAALEGDVRPAPCAVDRARSTMRSVGRGCPLQLRPWRALGVGGRGRSGLHVVVACTADRVRACVGHRAAGCRRSDWCRARIQARPTRGRSMLGATSRRVRDRTDARRRGGDLAHARVAPLPALMSGRPSGPLTRTPFLRGLHHSYGHRAPARSRRHGAGRRWAPSVTSSPRIGRQTDLSARGGRGCALRGSTGRDAEQR